MESIYVIQPNNYASDKLKKMISAVTKDVFIRITNIDEISDFRNKKLIFAMELNDIGYDMAMLNFLLKLHEKGCQCLHGSVGAVLIHCNSELYTKRAAQDVIFIANNIGCSFIGHSLIEATGTLHNFLTWQKTMNMSLWNICLELCSNLGDRLRNHSVTMSNNNNMLVLYSSPHETSNTLDLWHMISKHLYHYNIKELQLENGEIEDCKGCSYKLCIHYGKQNKCFYGGIMINEVLPAIENSDTIVWLCPNYNDAIAANLTAAINRLTVLYRMINFYHKNIYSIIVSGNSGSDSIAKQLIGALNINKGFNLPPYFSITATANDPGSIFKVAQIELKAKFFAEKINENAKAPSIV